MKTPTRPSQAVRSPVSRNHFDPPRGWDVAASGAPAKANRKHAGGWRWLLVLALLGAASVPSEAALRTWSGGGTTGNWTTGANWVGGTAPSAGDSLVFPSGAARLANTNNFAANTTFAAISISGVGYVIQGNPIVLTGGFSGDHAAGSSIFNPAIRLGAAQSFSASIATGTLILGGAIDLSGYNLTVSGSGVALLGGAISGTGNVIKTGTGRVELVGTAANTFNGVTTVNQGTLILGKYLGGGLVSVPGGLVIGDGVGADVVRLQSPDQIANTSQVSISASGLLDLNDWSDTVGGLTLGSGRVDTGVGTLTLAGNVTALGSGTSIIAGRLSLGSGTRTFDTASTGVLRVDAIISGPGGITKTGGGFLNLTAANTFSGVLTVQSGLLDVLNNAALGATSGRTFLQAGTLRLNSISVAGEPLTAIGGKLQSLGASNAWTGVITLTNEVVIEVSNTDHILNLAGLMTGPGGLAKTGTGALLLSGAEANSFAGNVTVDTGLLLLDKVPVDGAIPGPGDLTIGDSSGGLRVDIVRELRSFQIDASVAITVNDSGLLDLNDFSDTIGPLDLVGGWITTGTGLLTLAADVSGTSTSNQTARIYGRVTWGTVTRTFNIRFGNAAPELRLLANVSGSGSLRKTGEGWLGLSESNSYSGLTTLADGYLALEDDNALGTTAAGTVVEAGATLVMAGARIGNEPLTFNESATPYASTLTATIVVYSNSWAGPITLASPIRVSIPSASISINLAGAISGTGGFSKSGLGTLILSGTSGNTYAGDTFLNEGPLHLAKNAGTGVAIRYGRLIIGDGSGGASADRVRFLGNNQMWSTVPIDLTASGLLDLNGFSDTLGDLNFSGGRATSGSGGILYLAGSVTTDNGPGAIEGRIDLTATRNFNTAAAGGATLSVSAQVTGAGGLTKLGPGHLFLSNSNTYQGLTTISEGRLYADDDDALGSTAAGTIVGNGAGLVLRFGTHIGVEPLTVNGVGADNLGALSSIYGSNSWAGPITLGSSSRLTTLESADFLHLTGGIGGGEYNLTLEGSGTVLLSGPAANTYTGATRVYGGTLALNKSAANSAIAGLLVIGDGLGGVEADRVRLDSSTQIANTSDVLVNTSGLLDLNDHGDAIDALTGSGRVSLGNGFLNLGTSGGSGTYGGVIRGTGSLSKLGGGSITFSGDNTYTGPTSVGSGQLVVNGSQAGSAVTVATTATLGGGGTVGTITSTGGLISPGASPGRLSSGNVLLDAASTFVAELAGPTAGSLYDQLNVVGTVNLGGATLSLSAPALAPSPSDIFTLVNNDGVDAVVGTFAGLANGATFNVGPRQFRIFYNGGSGNDVILQPTGIPLALVGANVSAGNGNGVIDPFECNNLLVTLYNTGTNTVTGLQATLRSSTLGVTVTHARIGFPDIPTITSRAGNEPFQLSTSPFLVCGTIVDFALTVESASHGSFQLRFSLPSGSPGSPVTFAAVDTPAAIADSASITSTVTVAGLSAPVAKVTVSLYATHANLADLDINLIAPDGTTVALTTDNGGSTDSYGTGCNEAERTVFDDAASTSIVSGSPPYVGRFRPEVGLGTFIGLTGAGVNGVWKLRVTDDTAGNTGALNCWSLGLAPAACAPGTGPCDLCGDTTIAGVIPASEPDANRLVQNGVASSCGPAKPCPGTAGGMSEFHAYSFASGPANACVTVTVESGCPSTNALTSAAYLGSYNPLSICTGYLGDSGGGAFIGASRSYSFNVPANTNFWVIVQMITDNAPCADYTLTVSGADCRPALAIAPAAGNRVVLSWPTSAAGYELQATNALRLAPPNAFGPVLPGPVVVGGRYTVTNSASGGARFFRLEK